MEKAYICSPYRARSKEELGRNIGYARELTRKALEAGLAPVTPHLYIAQCLDEENAAEREMGMAAGLELLEGCGMLIAGVRHGISAGMGAEIKAAYAAGIAVVNADKLHYKLKDDKVRHSAPGDGNGGGVGLLEEYARLHACDFCRGNAFHTCTSFSCEEPYRKAYEYAKAHSGEITVPWGE